MHVATERYNKNVATERYKKLISYVLHADVIKVRMHGQTMCYTWIDEALYLFNRTLHEFILHVPKILIHI